VYFAQLNPKSSELADDELSNVAGGASFKVTDDYEPPVGGCNS